MTPSKTEHELEELLRAATPLPWEWGVPPDRHPDSPYAIFSGSTVVIESGGWGPEDLVASEPDLALLLAAVNALPALLAERKRLTEEAWTFAMLAVSIAIHQDNPPADRFSCESCRDIVAKARSILQEGSAGSALAEQEATDER